MNLIKNLFFKKIVYLALVLNTYWVKTTEDHSEIISQRTEIMADMAKVQEKIAAKINHQEWMLSKIAAKIKTYDPKIPDLSQELAFLKTHSSLSKETLLGLLLDTVDEIFPGKIKRHKKLKKYLRKTLYDEYRIVGLNNFIFGTIMFHFLGFPLIILIPSAIVIFLVIEYESRINEIATRMLAADYEKQLDKQLALENPTYIIPNNFHSGINNDERV